MGLPGGFEWIVILLAILILFGGKKIPELMKGLGQGIREFNAAKATVKENLEQGIKEDARNLNKSKEEATGN